MYDQEEANILNEEQENYLTGYIKLYRSLKKHWIWKASKTKSKAEAFVSLIWDANHQTLKEPIGFDLITINRGQILTSQEKLAKDWNWDRTAVRKFLEMLRTDDMIILETTSKYTMITLCKYDSYQGSSPTSQQQDNINATSTQHQRNTNNNANNLKNDNNVKNREARAKVFYEDLKPFLNSYKPEMLRSFYNYWTEINKSGTKMRFELERTWETSKRLITWANREKVEPKALGVASSIMGGRKDLTKS